MRILFFAQLKDVTGRSEFGLDPVAPLTTEALWVALLNHFPGLARHRPYVRLTRNMEYSGEDTLFHPGDEIAIIPPVSGG